MNTPTLDEMISEVGERELVDALMKRAGHDGNCVVINRWLQRHPDICGYCLRPKAEDNTARCNMRWHKPQ